MYRALRTARARLGTERDRSGRSQVGLLWSRSCAIEKRTAYQRDAYSVASQMRDADLDGSLSEFFLPSLEAVELKTAQVEGWILGLTRREAGTWR
jgi:hypothetical protein